jgi:hypothetical protein
VPASAETLRAGRRFARQAWSPAAGMILSILRTWEMFPLFNPFHFFDLIDEITNFILDLARIPLDEENPKGEKKPDDQENAQKDDHPNGDSKRKFFKDLLNVPLHSHYESPFSAIYTQRH